MSLYSRPQFFIEEAFAPDQRFDADGCAQARALLLHQVREGRGVLFDKAGFALLGHRCCSPVAGVVIGVVSDQVDGFLNRFAGELVRSAVAPRAFRAAATALHCEGLVTLASRA